LVNSNRSRGSPVSLWIRSIVKRFSSSCLPDERRVDLSSIDTSSPRQAINVVRIQITRFLPNGSPLCIDIEEISLIKLFFAVGMFENGFIVAAFLIVGHKHFIPLSFQFILIKLRLISCWMLLSPIFSSLLSILTYFMLDKKDEIIFRGSF
jgi:hypothetical protein